MKTRTMVTLAVFLLIGIIAQGQTTIWSENFTYPNGTTIGSGSPAKWTINTTTANVWSVQANQMQATNVGNEAVWTSQAIDISGYSNVSLFVDVSNGGGMDGNSDYLDVSYILDGGTETFFATNGENSSNFPPSQASQTGLSGNVVTIIVRIDNNKSTESHFFDNVIVTGNYTAVTWTGTTSNDWNVATNWSTGVIPNEANNITIPTAPAGGNFPETNSASGATCNNLTIETSAHVFVPAGKTLTINGTLANNAGITGLVLKSDAGGTGSLIHNSSGVDATVEQYLTGNQWHYVSSPISNATANVFFDIYLRSFNETIYNWNDYIIDPATPLTTMLGYASWVDASDATVSFEGPLNNGSTSIAVTANGGANSGWNLVGNPFPSALDWNAASGWGDRSNIDATIYFWEGVGGGGTGNYHYYTGTFTIPMPIDPAFTQSTSPYIPANQGFFIKAAGNVNLTVDNDARAHSSDPFWKSSQSYSTPFMRLNAMNEDGLSDETIIRFFEAATPEHDGAYDAFKLAGYNFPQLYSITPEQIKLAINTHPAYANGTIMPLGFTAPEAGAYSINLLEFVNFESGMVLYLEDLQADVMHSLEQEPEYVFDATPEDDPNRFLLHFTKNLAAVETPLEYLATVYSFGKTIYVKLAENNSRATLNVFNMMGQQVTTHQISGNTVQSLHLDAPQGFYVVGIQLGNTMVTKKVYLR